MAVGTDRILLLAGTRSGARLVAMTRCLASSEDRRNLARRLEDVFEIVDDEDHRAVGEIVLEAVGGGPIRPVEEPQAAGNLCPDHGGIGDVLEPTNQTPSGESGPHAARARWRGWSCRCHPGR